MKPIIVQKYGGTSVATEDHMKKVVQRIEQKIDSHRVVVVVSAMGNTTDVLIEKARKQNVTTAKELDTLVSKGENQSAEKFQQVLLDDGIASKVMNAFDIPIRTNGDYGQALIESINPQSILSAFNEVDVVIVPGFQGVFENTVTTLGRGGSDLTAVALSVSLGVDQCEIYTDVPGVMTTDPKVLDQARVLPHVSFDEMITLAYGGASVLQPRCVVLAKRYQLPIAVRSSFEDAPGTTVGKEKNVENVIISGIALKAHQIHTTITYPKGNHTTLMKELPSFCSSVLRVRNFEENVHLEILLQNQEKDQFDQWVSKHAVSVEQHPMSAVTIVGTGLRIQKEIFFEVQNQLLSNQIELLGTTISDGRICLMVPDVDGEKTIRVIHKYFGLEKEPN